MSDFSTTGAYERALPPSVSAPEPDDETTEDHDDWAVTFDHGRRS